MPENDRCRVGGLQQCESYSGQALEKRDRVMTVPVRVMRL